MIDGEPQTKAYPALHIDAWLEGEEIVKRDWIEARRKVEREGKCRYCETTRQVQAAHTISRTKQDYKDGSKRVVKADSIVPLCGPFANDCHGKYDRHELDLMGCLSLWEELNAVEAAGGIELARNRLIGKGG